MKRAMKKIVAAVLTVAMLLSITSVTFANPDFSGRNPATPVSLRVFHTRQLDPANTQTVSPGRPSFQPPIGVDPVIGAHWFAVRVTVPAGNIPSADLDAASNFIREGVGALPAGWAITSQEIGPVETVLDTNAGLAHFTATQLQGAVGTNAPGGAANCTNAMGQGFWFVWEEYSGNANCPHVGSNAVQGLTPSTIHRPFLVNLPHWVNTGDHIYGTDNWHGPDGQPAANQPGYWVYDVRVFPKPADQVPLTKAPGSAVPGVCPDTGAFTTRFPWTINAGIPSEVAVTNPGAGAAVIVNPLFNPINNPNLPDSLVGNPALGTHPATSYFVIRDILDYRVRLQNYTAGTSGIIAPGATSMRATTAMTVGIRNISANTVTPLPEGAWTLVSHTQAGVGTPAVVTLPGMQAAGAAIPPVTMAPSGAGVQVFWIHFTNLQAIIDTVGADNWDNISNFQFHVAFNAYSNNMTIDQMEVVDNDFDFYASRNPGANSGQQRDPNEVNDFPLFGVQIQKRNLDDALRNGARFELWPESQMSGAAGDADREPLAAYEDDPIRWTITGPGDPPHPSTSPMFGQTAGIGWLLDLPAGVYYIYEAVPPTGYTAIQGWRRVEVNATTATTRLRSCGLAGCTHVQNAEGIATTSCTDCFYAVHLYFTNVREPLGGFQLPLTGGAGTLMFTAAGVSLMGGAGLFLFLARKKDKIKDR